MLKEAEYPCWGAGFLNCPDFNKVVYAIFENWVVFSGIELENRTSTINAAESIVQAIADQEEIDIISYRWFDLQTRHGYRSLVMVPLQPGKFRLQELIFSINPQGPKKPGITQIVFTDEEGEEAPGEFLVIDSAGEEDFTVAEWRTLKCPMPIHEAFRTYIE